MLLGVTNIYNEISIIVIGYNYYNLFQQMATISQIWVE